MPDDTKTRHVRDHITFNRDRYLNLLKELRNFFESYMISREGKGRIYRIYSRGEKQSGEEFKDFWKIAGKISDSTSIYDVQDIIGLTIVCPFSSDMEIVKVLIKSQLKKRYFIDNMYEHNTAYKATHYIVKKHKSDDIRCEIQLKTAFHDSWALKAHDLTYKPAGSIDTRYESHMETLSSILSALERQTDIIKSMIDEAVYADQKKKDAAKRELINKLGDAVTGISNEKHRGKLETLIKQVLNGQKKYASADRDGSYFQQLRNSINEIGNIYGYERNLCRIIAAIVVLRPTNDCLDLAVMAIGRWKESFRPEKPYPAHCPYHFSSLVFYACSDIERAVNDVEESLRLRREFKSDDQAGDVALALTLGSAAHYYGELIGASHRSYITPQESVVKAKKLIEEALNILPDHPALIDTHGFVSIASALSEEEAEAGLARCRESWVALRRSDAEAISDLFFSIHKRLAYRRVLSLGRD